MEIFNMCRVEHICHSCKLPTLCKTYTWACPWINDDEIQMCDPCTEKLAEEMYIFEEAVKDEMVK